MALKLRKDGGSYRKIADRLRQEPGISDHYSDVQAYNDVKAELDRIKALCAEEAEAVRTLELERLDEILPKLIEGSKKGDWFAVDRLLKVMERRAKLLGLDAPEKRDVTSNGETIDAAPTYFYFGGSGDGSGDPPADG